MNSTWEFRNVGSNVWFPARVPGSVISDLNENKKTGKNVGSISDVCRFGWEYRTKFDVPSEMLEQDVVQLCFNRLGPYAKVYLNDSLVLKADNKFRTWDINCKSKLKATDNKLTVFFHHKHRAKKDSSVHPKDLPYGSDVKGNINKTDVSCNSQVVSKLMLLQPMEYHLRLLNTIWTYFGQQCNEARHHFN